MVIGGIDVSSYLIPPSTSTNQENTELQYNEPLERFMRNEIAYNEFMQMTGYFKIFVWFAGSLKVYWS